MATTIAFDVLARTEGEARLARMGSVADRTGHSIGGMGTKFSGAGDKLKRFARVAAIAAVAAAGFAVKIGVDSVKAASDLNETISKSEQIFGKGAKAMQGLADDADRMFGMSKQQALDAMSTFGVFGKSAGLAGKELTRFSGSFTGLAADMASFNNTTPQEAIEAIGAALRGESEPLRRYGILLDDATLRQEALKLGLIKTTKDALTPQQKVLAAQQAIWAQAGDQVGDFQRTSDGLANQQRILAAQFENVKAAIGQKLLPVAVKLMTWMNDSLIPGAQKAWSWLQDKLGPAFGTVAGWIDKFRSSGGKGSEVMAQLRDVVDAVKDALRDAEPFIRAVKTNFENMWMVVGPMLKKFAENYLPGVARNIRLLGKAAGIMGNTFIAVWNGVMQPFFSKLAAGVANIMDQWASMLDVMAHVPGFGWAKGAADKMRAAADQANNIAENIKKIPPYKRVDVDVIVTRRGEFAGPNAPDNIAGGDFPTGRQPRSSGRRVMGAQRSSMSGGGLSAADIRAALEGMVLVIRDGDAGKAAYLTAPGVFSG